MGADCTFRSCRKSFDVELQQIRDGTPTPRRRRRPARTLFGGLLRCGTCGGAVIAVSATAYGCAAAKDRGRDVCTGLYVPRQALDVRLLGLVRDEILAPIPIASVRRSLNAALTRKDRQGGRDAARYRAQNPRRDNSRHQAAGRPGSIRVSAVRTDRRQP